jgi:antitoxin ParD1/3/4
MNVSLTPELERFVATKVKTGRYNSASEVVREALRLLEENDKLRSAQIAEFNRELGRRLATLDAGEGIDGDQFFTRLNGRSRRRRGTRA